MKAQSSLAYLNFGQNMIFSIALSAAMILCANGINNGVMTVGDLVSPVPLMAACAHENSMNHNLYHCHSFICFIRCVAFRIVDIKYVVNERI